MNNYVLLYMQVNGQYIEWKQVEDVYKKNNDMQIQSQGLSILPKLKREHVHLTSFSRMRVDLAAQVSRCTDVKIPACLYTPLASILLVTVVKRPCASLYVHTILLLPRC